LFGQTGSNEKIRIRMLDIPRAGKIDRGPFVNFPEHGGMKIIPYIGYIVHLRGGNDSISHSGLYRGHGWIMLRFSGEEASDDVA
jgi:hypothetical protein